MKLEPYVGEPDVERLIAQVRGQKVDRVPNLENLVDDSHVEKILGRFAGNTLAYGGDPAKGASEATGRPMFAKDFVEMNRATGQDVLLMEAIWTPFKRRKADGTAVQITDRSIKTRADWAQVVHPSDADIADKMQYLREYKEAVRGTRQGVCLLFGAFMQTLYEFVVGLTDFMMMCIEDPEFVEEMFDVSAAYLEKLVEAAVAEKVDAVFLADDFAWKQGLFLPPKLFKELWFPRAARILAPAVRAGLPILFHSDGRIDDAVEGLIDLGVDCINPLDPYGVDYREYKKRYGDRLCLWGNIDIEWPLAHGTPEDVERDVIAHAEVLKPGGRWIAGSSHSITNFVPHENYVAMLNAIHKIGLY
jgi:uroporphyrinogen-III decarboxylase